MQGLFPVSHMSRGRVLRWILRWTWCRSWSPWSSSFCPTPRSCPGRLAVLACGQYRICMKHPIRGGMQKNAILQYLPDNFTVILHPIFTLSHSCPLWRRSGGEADWGRGPTWRAAWEVAWTGTTQSCWSCRYPRRSALSGPCKQIMSDEKSWYNSYHTCGHKPH